MSDTTTSAKIETQKPGKKQPTAAESLAKQRAADASAKKTKPAAKKPVAKATTAKPKAAAKPSANGNQMSMLEAADRVLKQSKESLNCQQIVEKMADKGYWTSPGGKTPASTLAARFLEDIRKNGKKSRFVKTDRGQFASSGAPAKETKVKAVKPKAAPKPKAAKKGKKPTPPAKDETTLDPTQRPFPDDEPAPEPATAGPDF